MNLLEGKGDLMGLARTDLPERGMSWKSAAFGAYGAITGGASRRGVTRWI